MATFKDIPQITQATYSVVHPWDFHMDWLAKNEVNCDPDFQRAHVWDETKQRRYIEFILRNGQSGRDLFFNHQNWMGSFDGEMVLVDGKQRVEAVRRFLNNKVAVFGGSYYRDFSDSIPSHAEFNIHVNNLKTRPEILQWYIDLNDGGVAHTPEEIAKVRALLESEAPR